MSEVTKLDKTDKTLLFAERIALPVLLKLIDITFKLLNRLMNVYVGSK